MYSDIKQQFQQCKNSNYVYTNLIYLNFTNCTVGSLGSDSKEFACNAGDQGSIPGLGRSPGGGHGNPFHGQRSLENPHGQRSLGYSSWGRKELDTTERLSPAQRNGKSRFT